MTKLKIMICLFHQQQLLITVRGFEICIRALARSENLGGHVVLGGNNLPPLVEIGLSDPSKTGGARAPPAPPRLRQACVYIF